MKLKHLLGAGAVSAGLLACYVYYGLKPAEKCERTHEETVNQSYDLRGPLESIDLSSGDPEGITTTSQVSLERKEPQETDESSNDSEATPPPDTTDNSGYATIRR
ncbi:MAG: hypothetical protein ABH864_02790 [archaeon]